MTLTAPKPLAPAMGAALDASAATFAWDSAPGAMARLQVSDSPGFAHPILDIDAGPVSEITLTDALEPTQEARFWRVGVVDASGETVWSRPRPFKLPEPGALPEIRSGVEKVQQAKAAATREATKAMRGRTVVPALPAPPVLPPLPTGATISGDPSATDWRRVPGVSVQAPEAEVVSDETPRVLGPLGGAIADGAAVVFRWMAVSNAVSYEIEVAPDLSGPTLRLDAGSTTELALNGVLPSSGDRLFWRVRAVEASGARGAWSPYGRFYAGTDLQATAYHDRQDSERAYARRVQEHEAIQHEAEMELVTLCERSDAVTSDAVAMAVAGVLSASILIGIALTIASVVGNWMT